ncbi:WXG100 family type VII secretion target [Streptomyces mexicanus]|jgi:uncharacterized protein YukE|uniref:WXG100 family type VII secretion target n=1 Tax=Streptomyces mexicanus TaxID=178566 RepID=UPI000ADECA9D
MSDNRLVNDSSVRSGVQALGTAREGVNRIRGNVAALSLGVNGDEGRAFQSLFRAWDEQANRIIQQIDKMTNALEDNRESARRTSLQHQESIQQQTSQVSAGVFEALT